MRSAQGGDSWRQLPAIPRRHVRDTRPLQRRAGEAQDIAPTRRLPKEIPNGNRDQITPDRSEPTGPCRSIIARHDAPVIGRSAEGGPQRRGNQAGVTAA